MLQFYLLLIFIISSDCQYVASDQSDFNKNTQEMAIGHGYPCENYTIMTEDGYKLLLFRIPGKQGESLENAKKNKRQPVILQHGILENSDSFLVNEKPAIAYVLADGGLDVWIPNFRGTMYSREHKTLDPDNDSAYWSFSMDELIIYDLKSIFDFVITTTKYTKISYVAHSMGGGLILAAASEFRDYYSKHIRSIVALGPSTCLKNANIMMKLVHYMSFLNLIHFLGFHELMNLHDHVHTFMSIFCLLLPSVCDTFIRFVADEEPEWDNSAKYDVFFNHYPDATSTTQAIHILQQVKWQGYYKYRPHFYNLYHEYDMTKIPSSIPIALFAGTNDKLVSIIDSYWLKEKLTISGSLRLFKELSSHGHLTFILPKPEDKTYDEVLEFTLNPPK